MAGLYCARRSSAGLALVRRTSALDRVAQGWADQLAQMHDTSLPHNPNYRTQALAACSSCTGWAENVGYWEGDDPDAVWSLWLNSPPHRANIDNASSGEFGIGVAYSDDGWLWIVHDFGRY